MPERAPLVTLRDGNRLPTLGFGTWTLDDIEATEVVGSAFERGYRLVDTSSKFGNEVGVGLAIVTSSIPREQLFVSTKVDGGHLGGPRTVATVMASLGRLGLDYLDLLLINYPMPHHENFIATWEAFAELQRAGLVRSIGVSQFSDEQVSALVQSSGVTPALNLRTGFGPTVMTRSLLIDAGELLAHPSVVSIAEAHDVTPAQVLLRTSTMLSPVTLVKSRTHQSENLAAFGIELTADEVGTVAGLLHASRPQFAAE